MAFKFLGEIKAGKYGSVRDELRNKVLNCFLDEAMYLELTLSPVDVDCECQCPGWNVYGGVTRSEHEIAPL